MKSLLWFIAGIIAGLVGQFFYEMWGKPALPRPEIYHHDVTFGYENFDELMPEVHSILGGYCDSLNDLYPLEDDQPKYDGWAERFNGPDPLEDTQPVKVE